MARPLMTPSDGAPAGGGTASDSDKARAGGKLPAGSSANDRAANGAKVANTAAKNAKKDSPKKK